MSSITHGLVASISQFFPDAVFYQKTSYPVVSLTIDDVGGADTLKILECETFSAKVVRTA